MKKVIVLLLLLGAWISLVNGQFIVTSSTPADGDVSTSLSTTIAFTFSAPLDTSQRFDRNHPVGLLLSDSLEIESTSFSADLKTIYFQVKHKNQMDFLWMVTGARSVNGHMLDQPFTLNYTTRPNHGNYIVSGEIHSKDGALKNTLVGLFDRSLFNAGMAQPIPFFGTISAENGSYTIPYVRAGVYWPICAKDLNLDGQIDPSVDAMGFFDANGDGSPDSILVGNNNLSGIDMMLAKIFASGITAKKRIDSVQALARQLTPDSQLRVIFSHQDSVALDGTSSIWAYFLYGETSKKWTLIFASNTYVMVDTIAEHMPQLPPSALPIHEPFIDSDVAVSIAELNGGLAFRRLYPQARRTVAAGNLFWMNPEAPTKSYWAVIYDNVMPNLSHRQLTLFIDLATGKVINQIASGIAGEENGLLSGFALNQNFPNPFNSETVISYSLPKSCKVELGVYDLCGRQVAILVDEEKASGSYQARLNAGPLPSGVYYYRLRAGHWDQTRRLVILK